jgi:hypothetical protein
VLPVERVFNDGIEIVIGWLPTEHLLDAMDVRNEGTRVAGSPRAVVNGKIAPGYLFN